MAGRAIMPGFAAAILAMAGMALALAGPALAQGEHACLPVTFPAGADEVDLAAVAPLEDVLCYSLTVEAGARLQVQILSGTNVAFSVIGLVDAQDDFRFTTDGAPVEILVGQLMRAVRPQAFELRITRDVAP